MLVSGWEPEKITRHQDHVLWVIGKRRGLTASFLDIKKARKKKKKTEGE